MRPMRLLLPILLLSGIAVAACGSDDSSSSATPSEAPAASGALATTEAPADDSSAASSAPTPDETDESQSGATIAVASNDALGDFLVDGQGLTVYLFEKDTGTTTACAGECAVNWPPVIADGEPTAGDGIDSALLGTADGIAPNQVTYNGHLLYYFIGDSAAGDTNGVGIPAWFALDPNGDAIESS